MRPAQVEWDPKKSEKNLEKHGIDFVNALLMWDGLVLEKPTKPGNDEERRAVYGMMGGVHWTAIVTYRGASLRVISVRRSRKKEAEEYDRFKRWQEEDHR